MKLRRLAALVSAAVLALGMVSAVSAHPTSTRVIHAAAPATESQCQNEQGQPTACGTDEASTEPTDEASTEPTDEASTEPTDEASTEPTDEASTEPSEDASTEPTDVVPPDDGQVEGLTSQPTLPPTDALSTSNTSGPDGTLPLVLIVLGVIGLAAVVLTPARAKR